MLNSVVAVVLEAVEMMAGLVGHLSLAQAAAAVGLEMMKGYILAQEVMAEPGAVIRQGMAYQAEPQAVTLARTELVVLAMDAGMAAQAVALMQILLLVGREVLAVPLAAAQVEADVVMTAQVGKVEQAQTAQLEFIHGR